MKPDARVIGVVLAVLAAAVILAVWLQDDEPPDRAVVQELAGPRTPAPAPAVPPAPAAPPAASAAAPAPVPEAVSATVLFEFDRAALREAEAAKLDRLLAKVSVKAVRLEAVGHADRIGPAAYNLGLSRRRADAVKAYLMKKEVDPGAVRTEAKGELEPASGDECAGMGPELRRNTGLVECLQPDRRVKLTVLGAA